MTDLSNLPREPFVLHQGDEQILQLGVGLTIFLPRPFDEVRDAVFDMWTQYLNFVGKDKFTWARLGGGNRSRAANKAVFTTINDWLTGKKPYGKHCWISIHSGPKDELGDYGFELEGLGEANELSENVGFVDLSFPLSVVAADPQAFSELVNSLCQKVPFYCGTAGFVFQRSPFKFSATISKVAALSNRYQGIEIRASEREAYWAAKGLVSVNWITLLGQDLADQLGGKASITKKLPKGCTVTQLDHGISIRAGDQPLIGDKNSGNDELALWRQVYKVLKPAQFVDPVYEFDPFEFDGERTIDWLTRLDK